MGIISQTDKGDGAGDPEISPESPRPVASQLEVAAANVHPKKDPIWAIPREEALRLCQVYEDEIGLMYPVLDINAVVTYASKLYRFMEAARRSGLLQHTDPGTDNLDDDDTNILKLVLAAAETVEASGRSDIGLRLFESVQPAIDRVVLGSVTKKSTQILAMAVSDELITRYNDLI
jgi:hypothetical protein